MLTCLSHVMIFDLTSGKVNRVGEAKLSLDKKVQEVARIREELESVRKEAEVERTTLEEKARFDAHRPQRLVLFRERSACKMQKPGSRKITPSAK